MTAIQTECQSNVPVYVSEHFDLHVVKMITHSTLKVVTFLYNYGNMMALMLFLWSSHHTKYNCDLWHLFMQVGFKLIIDLGILIIIKVQVNKFKHFA